MDTKIQKLEKLKRDLELQRLSWASQCAEVGDFTYADHPKIWTWGEGAKLYIEKFCSIGANVQFLLGGNHHTEWCSTYPFNVLTPSICPNEERCASTKGDIRIGNDVWIGNDAVILSGVTIGDGAVIANSAVVTQSVSSFMVVGGVPAKPIKQRFQANVISILQWWNWPLDKLAEALPILCSKDYNALFKFHEEWNQKFDN